MRKRGRIDGNHVEIVQTLRDLGVSVFSTAGVGQGFPDLVCGYHGTHLLELKDGSLSPSRRRLTEDERAWHESWLGEPVEVVKSPAQAAELVEYWDRLEASGTRSSTRNTT
jgi:hypothetical protein